LYIGGRDSIQQELKGEWVWKSASVSRYIETMLTVIEICRRQRRNAFSFLTQAVAAHLAHTPAPLIAPRGVNRYVRFDMHRLPNRFALTTG